jgi:hypothetical protein
LFSQRIHLIAGHVCRDELTTAYRHDVAQRRAERKRYSGADGSSADGSDHQQELTGALGSGRLGFCFRHVGGDRIHQGWRQAIIGFQSDFPKTRADAVHLCGVDAGLDHR